MTTKQLIIQSFSTLTVNKMRTGLAILGIVIGIGSVIALLSLGQASQQAIQSQIQSLGSNLLTVMPGSVNQGGVRGAQGGSTTLKMEDATAMQNDKSMTLVKKVSPEISRRSQVMTGGSNANTQIYGVTAAYMEVHKVTMASGSFISDRDATSMNKVAVVGSQVVTNVFNGADPIGQSIRVAGQSLTVIGVTNSKGGSGFMNQDDVIYTPITVAQKQLFGMNYISSIALEATSEKEMTAAQDQVGYFLLKRHQITDPAKADFSIMSQQEILNTASAMTGTFTALLSGIAAISLLVGGIGIMNIMLVTVTERTREIGLRKALGAKKKVIIQQFLIESIMLTFTGGIIGATLGVGTSYILAKLLNVAFVISTSSIGLAFVVSAAVGIIFGWYPAKRASELQPIEALRYE